MTPNKNLITLRSTLGVGVGYEKVNVAAGGYILIWPELESVRSSQRRTTSRPISRY